MDLLERGYKPPKNGKRRRRIIKKAIQDSNFDHVFQELKHLKTVKEGYKKQRVIQDLLFLKQRSDRYYTEKESYKAREQVK